MNSESAVLRRPRLLSELDRLLSVSLALVTAPAGYGKSVLLRDWADRRSEVDTAWVDLSDRDNDPMRFWRRTFERIGEATAMPLDGLEGELGAGRPGEVLRALDLMSDSLAGLDRRLVLIFDDFHLIRSPEVLETFEFFRDTAPDNVAVVLGARRDPPLGVARLRVLDELVEIREKDLRFTESEIADLTDAAHLEIDAAAVTVLHNLTEGWAAAVRLALILIANSDNPSLLLQEIRQDHPDIAEFFAEEVLSGIPDPTREFLLATSVLEQVNASNACALSGAEDAQALLEDLAARSLLTTRVAGSNEWFRYHRLFRRLLLAELRRSRTEDEIQELNRRAASWYLEQHDRESAIPHAIAASDQETATNWLAELSPHLMETGRAATLLDLSDQIIDSVEAPTISQLVCKGEALHGLGLQPDEFDRILSTIEQRLDNAEETAQTREFATRSADPRSWESPSTLPWLRAVRFRLRGDAEGLVRLLETDAIPSPSGVVEAEAAEALIWLERYGEAEQMLQVSMAKPGNLVHTVHHLGLLATLRAGQGRFAEAHVLVDRALALSADHHLGQMRHTMYSRMTGAGLAWGRGDLEVAESNAVDVQIFAEQFADIPLATQHALMRSGVRWSLGDGVGARALLDRATVTITGRPITGHFADRLRFAKAKIDLLEENPRDAQFHVPDWRDRLEAGPTLMGDWLLLMRMANAEDGPGAIVDELPPPGARPSSLHLAEWHRIHAHALDLLGSREAAERELASSLETGDHLSLVQPLIDERHILGSLLPAAARRVGLDLPGLEALEDAPVPRPVYIEPLTDREQVVLGYMATHLSYPEIAAELYVSNNTVKSHCKSIFRKLAVSRRADAVTRARAYGLIND